MSTDTMYINRSRMLPAHGKNKSHIVQTPPHLMKRSKSSRKSLEVAEKKAEQSRSSTPTPIDLKANVKKTINSTEPLAEVPRMQTLPNGEKPNFGNSSNTSNNSKHTGGKHSKQQGKEGHSSNKTHTRKKSGGKSQQHKRENKDNESSEKKKSKTKEKKNKDSKKSKSPKHQSTELVTNHLKNLLLNNQQHSSDRDVNINRVQNNPSPLTTFMTSPIITPETIPPQLRINNNSSNNSMINQNHIIPQMQQQQQHSIYPHDSMNRHNNTNMPHVPLSNGIMSSPIMHPLTPFQMSSTIPPYPFGNNNMNYSISNMPLPMSMPSYASPQPVQPHQTGFNGVNIANAGTVMRKVDTLQPVTNDSGGGGNGFITVTNNVSNISNLKINTKKKQPSSPKSNNPTNSNKNKNGNKKIPHSFAGASFATDVPQECNLPKPSFL